MLVPATKEHLKAMLSWFPDRLSVVTWGGPEFRFPFTEQSFYEDSWAASLASCALVEDSGELLAFGQYYPRVGRCHLGRLAVNPARRGQGLGTRLIASLVELGAPKLGAEECSLFVSAHNPQAKRLYDRLGFVAVPYPEAGGAVPNSYYMIAPVSSLKR
jgi:ribosomal protein S18 acetylase RimI-like enzyme